MPHQTASGIAAGNSDQARAWDGATGDHWTRHADRFDACVARYDAGLFDAARVNPGHRVLDVGCGAGHTTLLAAKQAGDGEALGVDLSSALLGVARERADRQRLTNVRFAHGDAQIYDFPASHYDLVISRTGAMFFGDPAAAFANLARAHRPGGRLVLLVWQRAQDNQWFEMTARTLTGATPQLPPSGVPGPFGLADPDHVEVLLTGAGYGPPEVTPLREPLWFGADAADAHEFLLGLFGWMLDDGDPASRAAAEERLLHTLQEQATKDGVLLGSATWLITTTRS